MTPHTISVVAGVVGITVGCTDLTMFLKTKNPLWLGGAVWLLLLSAFCLYLGRAIS